MTGPFASEQEALDLPAVRDAYAAFRAGRASLRDGSRAMLTAALSAAGVELGAHDERIAAWVGQWEPQTVAVIAGFIARAHESGKATAVPLDDTSRAKVSRARVLAAAHEPAELRAWFASQGDTTTATADSAWLYGCTAGAAQALIGELLAIIDRGTATDPLIAKAVADAIDHRTEYRDGWCADCARLEDDHDGPGPAPLCGDHQADADAAARYELLLASLRPASDAEGGQP